VLQALGDIARQLRENGAIPRFAGRNGAPSRTGFTVVR
jgi:hypothetical protein